VGAHHAEGQRRTGMKFDRLDAAARVRLELTVFNALLQHLP